MKTEDLPDEYFATCLTDNEAEIIHQMTLAVSDHGSYRAILEVIAKLVRHISALQDKITCCDAGCNCACDFDAPGDVCSVHYEYRTITHGQRQSNL